jgi:predicted MFS family arabinose efflux permease
MIASRVLLGIVALSATNAIAGVPALGVNFGQGLGGVLGAVLGSVLGTSLPVVGGGLLAVAAVSLLVGVHIAKRKKNP